MTNAKTTKKALLASSMSMLLCVSMLIGSTFAWFTDTASTGLNKIMAGNLNVELYMKSGSDYVNISEDEKPIFGSYGSTVAQDNNLDTLWEPGKTQIAYLKIANEGNLALKYQVALNTINPADSKDLYKVMQYQIVPDAQSGATWTAGAGNSVTPGTAIVSAENVQMQPGDEHYFALLIHMDKNAGNEYMDGKVEFDISVLATQLNAEADSFGKEYDASAEYDNIVNNAQDLANALAAGENVVLGNDISVEATITAPYGNKAGFAHDGGVFDGDGNTIGITNGGDNYAVMTAGGTIKNLNINDGFRGVMIMNPTQDIILNNVVSGGDVCYALNTGEGDGTHSLIANNSTFNGWSSIGTAVKDATFTNCKFGQGDYYTDVFGRLVKPYVYTLFDGCEFISEFYIDLSQLGKDGDGNVLDPDAKIVLRNCTVNGVKLTADNWKTLIVSEADCGDGQISIEGKDGSYMTASNIFDYVIIE